MDTRMPVRVVGRPRAAVVSMVLAGLGVVLPVASVVGLYPFVTHGRVMTGQELALALFGTFLGLALELAALAYGLAAPRTPAGLSAVVISGALLAVAGVVFAFGLTLLLDHEAAGWLAGTPFWVVTPAVLAAVSLAAFALARRGKKNRPGKPGRE